MKKRKNKALDRVRRAIRENPDDAARRLERAASANARRCLRLIEERARHRARYDPRRKSPPVRRNSDLDLRRLEREWLASQQPEAGEHFAAALLRAGDEKGHALVQAEVSGVLYQQEPSPGRYEDWFMARHWAGIPYWEGTNLDPYVWAYVNSGFADEEVGDALNDEAYYLVEFGDAEGFAGWVVDEAGGEDFPGLTPLAARLPVDTYRFAYDHAGAVARLTSLGQRSVAYYDTPEELQEAWAEIEVQFEEDDDEEEECRHVFVRGSYGQKEWVCRECDEEFDECPGCGDPDVSGVTCCG